MLNIKHNYIHIGVAVDRFEEYEGTIVYSDSHTSHIGEEKLEIQISFQTLNLKGPKSM